MRVSRKQLRMSDEEVERFLTEHKYGRLATANRAAEPHVTPLGYVYHDGAIWFHALRGGRRDRDLAENPQVAFLLREGDGDLRLHTRGLRYTDELERRDGAWRIVQRVHEVFWEATQPAERAPS